MRVVIFPFPEPGGEARVAPKPAVLWMRLMCFDIAVTELQLKAEQRDSEGPRESDTQRRKRGLENGMEAKTTGNQSILSFKIIWFISTD